MLDGLDMESSLLYRIKELISLKATISESYLHKGEKELIKFIETCISLADEQKKSLPTATGNEEELNAFFLKYIS